MLTDEFRYDLPRDAIAPRPIDPRDAARLLDTRDLSDLHFRDLPSLLRPGDLLVVNTTRVRAARLRGRKADTGGGVELLVLTDFGGDRWSALIRPARRIRPGVVLDLGSLEGVVEEGPRKGRVIVRLVSPDGDPVEEVIERAGTLPLPPYVAAEPEDPEMYQTVYAERLGSAAAPTAGLHFTLELLASLRNQGIEIASLTLDVGIDTFRPISTTHIEDHRMHSERYCIPTPTAGMLTETRRRGGRIVAVGTTVVRALESRVGDDGVVRPGPGSTGLYVTPGYRFRVVDALITNFHLPASTVLVLVAAFMGARWRDAYEHALERGYRFLSFGDAMYVERSDG